MSEVNTNPPLPTSTVLNRAALPLWQLVQPSPKGNLSNFQVQAHQPPDFADLQKRNLRARVSPPFSLNSTALFLCERELELPLRAHSRPPTNVTTPRVTDAPFPLHVRKMRAQSAVRYVRSKRVTNPDGLAASSKLYCALDRYINSDTRPNFEKIH